MTMSEESKEEILQQMAKLEKENRFKKMLGKGEHFGDFSFLLSVDVWQDFVHLLEPITGYPIKQEFISPSMPILYKTDYEEMKVTYYALSALRRETILIHEISLKTAQSKQFIDTIVGTLNKILTNKGYTLAKGELTFFNGRK